MPMWYVYILECRNGSLYTGVTNDLERRLEAHRSGRGARYTRAFGVKRLARVERKRTKSSALKREAAIKRLDRQDKLTLIG